MQSVAARVRADLRPAPQKMPIERALAMRQPCSCSNAFHNSAHRTLRNANPSGGFAPHSSCPTTFRHGTVFSAPLDARQLDLPGGEFPVVEDQHGTGAIVVLVDEGQMLRALVG